MDVAVKIHTKLKKILKKLKNLGIIEKYKLEINFCQVEENLKRSLVEIDSVLKKCLRKIINKPRKAEIRNIISELVRKKNSSDVGVAPEPTDCDSLGEKSFFQKPETSFDVADAFKYNCNFCEEIFYSRKKLINHKKTHTSENFLCENCGKLFNNLHNWEEHLKECNKLSPLPLTLKYFPNNEILTYISNLHVLEVENQVESKIISEDLIDTLNVEVVKNTVQKNNLENQKPEEVQKFVCSCGKTFRNLKTLRKHEKLKHSLLNIKYDCSTCGKSFMEKGKLNRHMLSHKESQYGCSFCSKQFSRSDTLKRHISLFHSNSKEFLCRYCQKMFKLKFNRDIHEENIHKNISNQIQCQHCGGKFKSKVTLKSHLKIHFGDRTTCALCCKTFTRRSYYKKHVKTKHQGVENPSP